MIVLRRMPKPSPFHQLFSFPSLPAFTPPAAIAAAFMAS
jgi:hypothetical protein